MSKGSFSTQLLGRQVRTVRRALTGTEQTSADGNIRWAARQFLKLTYDEMDILVRRPAARAVKENAGSD